MKILITDVNTQEQKAFVCAFANETAVMCSSSLTDSLIKQHYDTQVLIIFIESIISQAVLDALPNLKLIITRSTGFDHIDIHATYERNIVVCNIPSYATTAVSEYTFALILELSRKICSTSSDFCSTQNITRSRLTGYELNGKTLGIIGTGAIGCAVAHIANGFGMKCVAYDIVQQDLLVQKKILKYVSLLSLLQQSDIISLHAPSTPQTHFMINDATLNDMKTSSLLINTARSTLIDTDALIKALDESRIAGCALDVLEHITSEQSHKLLSLNNCLITPHNAYNTYESTKRSINATVDIFKAYQVGNPLNVVRIP